MAGYKGRKDRLEPPERIPQEKMGLWDLIKAGAIVVAIVLIAKIILDLLSRFGGFLKSSIGRAWRIFKANVVIFVAVPLALASLAVLFPESAEMLDDGVNWARRTFGLSDLQLWIPDILEVPEIFGPAQALEPSVDLPLAPELKDCTLSLSYISVEEDKGEKRCMELCRDRDFTSYGVQRDGSAYDCYCCYGAGKPVE